jgi:hypothetical protein
MAAKFVGLLVLVAVLHAMHPFLETAEYIVRILAWGVLWPLWPFPLLEVR